MGMKSLADPFYRLSGPATGIATSGWISPGNYLAPLGHFPNPSAKLKLSLSLVSIIVSGMVGKRPPTLCLETQAAAYFPLRQST